MGDIEGCEAEGRQEGIVSGKRLRQRLRFPEAWPDLYSKFVCDGLQARPS
jgi:hypothetical protein